MEFLLLHSEPKGLPVLLNTRYIMRAYPNDDDTTTIIAQRPDGASLPASVHVRESLSDIAKQLKTKED